MLLVSMTSFPGRIDSLKPTINSILNQTVQPDKFILWLAEEQFPNKEKDLPRYLLELQNDLFTIEWCSDLRSYKKLIPALRRFPDSTIITIDDDKIYNKAFIEELLMGHAKFPKEIIAHAVYKMQCLNGVTIVSSGGYEYWPKPSFLNVQLGGGGCLYPPSSLHMDVLNEDMFMKLAPTNDDLWFWGMAVLNGTKIYRLENGDCFPKNNNLVDQSTALNNVNNCMCGKMYKDLDNILYSYDNIFKKICLEADEFNKKCDSCISDNIGNYFKHLFKNIGVSLRRTVVFRPLYQKYLVRVNRKKFRIAYLERRVDMLERYISETSENSKE